MKIIMCNHKCVKADGNNKVQITVFCVVDVSIANFIFNIPYLSICINLGYIVIKENVVKTAAPPLNVTVNILNSYLFSAF